MLGMLPFLTQVINDFTISRPNSLILSNHSYPIFHHTPYHSILSGQSHLFQTLKNYLSLRTLLLVIHHLPFRSLFYDLDQGVVHRSGVHYLVIILDHDRIVPTMTDRCMERNNTPHCQGTWRWGDYPVRPRGNPQPQGVLLLIYFNAY